MRNTLLTCLAVSLFSLTLSVTASAADSAVGRWKTIDDDTGKPKSIVEITQAANGSVSGRIVELINPSKPNPSCDKCSDDRKDKPILGMEIIRGARKAEGRDVWEGGRILDPEKGSTYSLRLTPIDGGSKLEVRGSIGPFGRTQTWQRVP